MAPAKIVLLHQNADSAKDSMAKQKKKKKSRTIKSSRGSSGSKKQARGDNRSVESISTEPESVALRDLAQSRYLNYALSVITSRALPDVRDGLKPVQRRILYTMWQQRITADSKHRKCAGVVGATMQYFHPHGGEAIYDALVRLAQNFVMRSTLVDGSGNFGSLDGDPPAAMRYTECRLTPIASNMLNQIDQGTVDMRPNYDSTKNEPVVLPSKLPNLLVNGATGIAVGMATNIPPHNPIEVCKTLLKLLDNPELKTYQLVANDAIQGPDFPTGGQILNTRDELREIYKTGTGAIRIRATWQNGPTHRSSKTLNITSIPYGVNKAQLVERIADIVLSRKMPLLMDVVDLSTDEVQISLELKKEADDQKVLAYLFKNTALQTNFNVNLTCLLPTENTVVGRPERCDLRQVLRYFLNFRLEVVTRRLQHELETLNRRIRILEGFATIFEDLDAVIKIIRNSDGKSDSSKKLIARFQLDAEQVDAILELKLYRLARLEIQTIREDLNEKRQRAREIRKLLDDNQAVGRWEIVRNEINEVSNTFSPTNGRRRTLIESVQDEPEFSDEDFIVAEDNHVLLTVDGWVKRQKEIKNPASTRLREGDRVLACEAGSTRATIVFLSSVGTAYTARIADLPATTGFGEPIQKLFKLKDGERIVAAFSLDPRSVGQIQEKQGALPPQTHAIAATSDGFSLRFGLGPFIDPSTRNGRRFARPAKGAEVVSVEKIHGEETILAASRQRRVVLCPVQEINFLSGAGKGVRLMKLAKDDQLLGMKAATDDRDTLTAKTSQGGTQRINTGRYGVTSRGGKGREILKRGSLSEIVPEEPVAPIMLEEDS